MEEDKLEEDNLYYMGLDGDYPTEEDRRGYLANYERHGHTQTSFDLAIRWGFADVLENIIHTTGNAKIFGKRIHELGREVLIKHVENYCHERGIGYRSHNILDAVVAASNLVDEYDVGVPLTTGGIYTGSIFNLFGLPLVTAKTKRRGRGAEFSWIDDPELLEGKKVLVFEDDVITGRTIRRVGREIEGYNPSRLDVFFALEAGYSDLSAIPTCFGRG